VFRGASDPNATPGIPPDSNSFADLKWFEVFKDSQLQDLIKTASTQNFDIREAVARVSAARAVLGLTRAEQFPEISASGEITKLRNSTRGSFPLPSGASRDRTFGTVLLNLLSFEVDVWGRLRRQTEAARAQLQGSEEDRKAIMTTLVSDIATSYFALLELDMELDIARRTLAARQESLALIKVRQQGGVATMLEVRQGEQLVYTASQTVPDVERQIEQTENLLNLLAGKNPAGVARGQSLTAQEQPPSVPPGLPSSLLERRPDIRAAEQFLIAANANIGVAKAAYFPQISLTGFLGSQSNQLSNLFRGPTSTWQFIPQITQPIFNAGRIKSNVKLAKAQQEIALIEYERSIRTAFREVSDALAQYRKVREIRTQQDLLVTTLEDRSRLAYLRYRGGVDTLLSALDADRDLFNAQLSLAQTKRDELLSLVQLYKALGGGWQQ
jgi:multidrug efflux system outer membrane protein